jgi:hypothetical protein
VGIDKDYSIEDVRKASVEKLDDILGSCQSPGHYQMAVEELQRRFLQDIASQTQKLTESSQRVETVTGTLERTVARVGESIGSLVESSNKMERLTKWIMWLTVALFLLTVLQLAMVLREQFTHQPKGDSPVPQTQPNMPPKAP